MSRVTYEAGGGTCQVLSGKWKVVNMNLKDVKILGLSSSIQSVKTK